VVKTFKDPHEISLVFHPLTPEAWSDFEELFGRRGACGGCWCMWWRLKKKDFKHKFLIPFWVPYIGVFP
jgi:hypothetical protein